MKLKELILVGVDWRTWRRSTDTEKAKQSKQAKIKLKKTELKYKQVCASGPWGAFQMSTYRSGGKNFSLGSSTTKAQSHIIVNKWENPEL